MGVMGGYFTDHVHDGLLLGQGDLEVLEEEDLVGGGLARDACAFGEDRGEDWKRGTIMLEKEGQRGGVHAKREDHLSLRPVDAHGNRVVDRANNSKGSGCQGRRGTAVVVCSVICLGRQNGLIGGVRNRGGEPSSRVEGSVGWGHHNAVQEYAENATLADAAMAHDGDGRGVTVGAIGASCGRARKEKVVEGPEGVHAGFAEEGSADHIARQAVEGVGARAGPERELVGADSREDSIANDKQHACASDAHKGRSEAEGADREGEVPALGGAEAVEPLGALVEGQEGSRHEDMSDGGGAVAADQLIEGRRSRVGAGIIFTCLLEVLNTAAIARGARRPRLSGQEQAPCGECW
mmetsp:Transcript_25242/g.70613  ORF Transcript_25242/g.70613 Transcript_25242/m.70613 type:complete len:351 (-) Transcript_25242:241-1293(-)